MFRSLTEWRLKSRQTRALAARTKVERLAEEASVAADERRLSSYSSDLKQLADMTRREEADLIIDAVRFARARQGEFHQFLYAEPMPEQPPAPPRRLSLPGEPWVWQVAMVLYLFTILLAFMIGMIYSPAITMGVALANLLIMFLWPGWGVSLSIVVVIVALINVFLAS